MTEFVLAKETDAPTIAHLRQRVWTETYRNIYPEEMIDHFDYAWHTRQDLARIQSPVYLVYLIMEAGEAVGYLTLKTGKRLLLLSVYILADHRRRGIGRAAFRLIRRYCIDQGIAGFTCQCQSRNGQAMAFYHAMGGMITARDEDNAEAWQDSVTFSFRIT